jgi:hypothetical protein
MSQVPNAANAIVADEKITKYLLDTTHSSGGGKAKFFQAFGFTPTNWIQLRAALLQHALTNPVIKQITASFRVKYVVSCSIQTPDGRNPCVLSIRAIEPPDPEPRLLTAYANPGGRSRKATP